MPKRRERQRAPRVNVHRTAFYTARIKAALTQPELSRATGVPQTLISDLETGRNKNPSWSVLNRIAQVLGVRPEQLIPYTKLPKGLRTPTHIISEPLHDIAEMSA